MPTFTPPPYLPQTSPNEHYWLWRPVDEDKGARWTDKHYPYGSNMNGTLRTHHGVEFNVPTGTELIASAAGTVVVAGNDNITRYGETPRFYGNLVVIQLDHRHNNQPVYILYGHLSEIFVQPGQRVKAKDIIALSGASGIADGSHLHFEVRVGENKYENTRNPILWLYPFEERGSVAGRVVWPNGELAQNVPIRLRRIDASSRYAATTTYASNSVHGDDKWQENFAFDDVEAGYYELIIESPEYKIRTELWVYEYKTSFVELVLTP